VSRSARWCPSYDDQGTHHAAALTYYALMSLLPLLLLAVSLLGLLGEFPGTYNSIIHYLRRVVPATTLAPLDAAVRAALRSKGTAVAALVLGVLVALYGATGYLEAARRALNVVFDSHHGLRRKLTDLASTVVLLALVLATVVLMFAGVGVVRDLFGPGAATVWRIGRWPAALISALLVFSFLYFVTPDVEQRAFGWITPGAAVGVTLWLLAWAAFSVFIGHFSSFNVTTARLPRRSSSSSGCGGPRSHFYSAPRSTPRSNPKTSSRRASSSQER
jgi:membrane protein